MNFTFVDMQHTVTDWLSYLASNTPIALGVIVVLAVFYLLAKFGQRMTTRASQRAGAPHSLQVLLANTTHIAILIVGIVVALSMLGLGKAVTTALAGAGVIGIVLGFALQDIAANFISGIILILRKPFREGDLVEINDHLGTVREINLRTTKIQALTGQIVYIPNQVVFQNDLTNFNELGERRVDISCGVSYADDLDKARKVAVEAIESLDFADTDDHSVEFYYNEFGGSSINFTLRFWIDFSIQPDYLAGQSEAIRLIKNTFDEKDIAIPFPVRTLDFGIKAGENLKSQLNQN